MPRPPNPRKAIPLVVEPKPASSVFPEEIRLGKGVLSRPFLLLLKAEE
jgi:hypothetical protein